MFSLLTGVANATPSTQIWIPSTDIQKFGSFHLGLDTYITAGESEGPTLTVLGLTTGLLPYEKLQLEAGLDYKDLSGTHEDPLYFNAKLGLPEGALFEGSPALAAGGYDIYNESGFKPAATVQMDINF